jgi:hypothetical protein
MAQLAFEGETVLPEWAAGCPSTLPEPQFQVAALAVQAIPTLELALADQPSASLFAIGGKAEGAQLMSSCPRECISCTSKCVYNPQIGE